MKEKNFNIKVGATFELKKAYGLADGYIFKGEVKVIRIYGEGIILISVLNSFKLSSQLPCKKQKNEKLDFLFIFSYILVSDVKL